MKKITQYVNKPRGFLFPGELEPYLLIYAQQLSEQGYCMLRPEPITRFGIIRSLISGLTDHSFRFEPIVLELFPK